MAQYKAAMARMFNLEFKDSKPNILIPDSNGMSVTAMTLDSFEEKQLEKLPLKLRSAVK